MKHSYLRKVVAELGTDPSDWSADERRLAVIELYEQDQADPKPGLRGYWMNDALDLTPQDCRAILEGLKHEHLAMRFAAVGKVIVDKLLGFPLDYLQQTAEDHEATWLALAEESEDRDEADRRNDAARAGA